MDTFFFTDPTQWGLLILRVALGLVILPHGAQKLLGWFGGNGFKGTMGFFTGTLHIPAPAALLVIVAEFFGALGLIFGLFTRLDAFGIALVMLGAAIMAHRPNGFFMNWGGKQKGEGFEFHILAIGMALVLLVYGGGPLSLDGWLRALAGV